MVLADTKPQSQACPCAGNYPLVSVVMNCYNGGKYLRQAVESVLSQTYTNWELVFWDNQSTDGSADIFKNYNDPRLKYFYAPQHTLLYEARNYALAKTKGELIAFLDVDDWWTPEKLQKQVPLFNDVKVGLACCNFWIYSDNGNSKIAHRKPLPSGYVLDLLLEKYFVGLLTLVVRRQSLVVEEGEAFDPQFHIIGDFDAVMRVAAGWEVASLQEPLAFYRQHSANESRKGAKLRIDELDIWKRKQFVNTSILNSGERVRRFDDVLNYIKGLCELSQRGRLPALRYWFSMPWGRLKPRLLAKIFSTWQLD